MSLAEHLLVTFGRRLQEVRLLPAYGGVFEVWVNGALVHSKRATGRFPTDEEIDQAIEASLAGG